MHILLVRPGVCGHRVHDALPPLALGVLKARTPPQHQVSFVDDALGESYEGPDPDLVAITVQTFSALRAYDLSAYWRTRDVPVVLGGYHPTLMPDEASQHATSIVIGDAEDIWEQLLEDCVQGELKSVYTANHQRSLDDAVVDRTIFGNKKYPKIELAWFTRGCRFECDFCAIKVFYSNVRVRRLDAFAAELATLNQQNILFVVDDNIYASKSVFQDLLGVLRQSGMSWACQISIDVARDAELVALMACSGCVLVTIGFESLNKDTLKQIGKGWNVVSGSYREVVARFHQYGIAVYGTFVFGYDTDTLDTIEEAYVFAMESKLEIANFNPLTPMPGSSLYHRLGEEKRLIRPTWWIDRDYRYGDPIFLPRNMDPTAFVEKCYWAKQQFYSWSGIAKRLIFNDRRFSWTLAKAALAANIVSHREIVRKQHHTLGGD